MIDVPTFNISELISKQKHGIFLVEGYSSDWKRLHMFSHGLSHVLLLQQNFILEFAVTDCIKSQQSVDCDADETFVRIKEKDMLYLLFVIAREHLVPVAQKISNNCVSIIAASCHDLTAHADCHRVDALFVLFHCVSH